MNKDKGKLKRINPKINSKESEVIKENYDFDKLIEETTKEIRKEYEDFINELDKEFHD